MNAAQLKHILPRTPDEWVQPVIEVMPRWEINTPLREAAFVAQLAHESAQFTRTEENLSYSAEGLMRTWPQRFPSFEIARQYERQPEKIANKVYASRMGNGDAQSGDGWHYRGRGPIQLTGRANYHSCGLAIGQPLEEFPELVLRPSIGIEVACHYWTSRGLNELADREDFTGITKAINGGLTGHAERTVFYERAKSVLNGQADGTG